MKTSCFVYIATSLDGFIAKPDGDINWLHDPSFTIEGEDFGFEEFMNSIDALVMGRNTFEKVLSFGKWPYSKPVIVLTSRSLSIPNDLEGKVFPSKGTPSEIVEEASKLGYRHLYIDGGKTIQYFLNAGLIDQLIITRIPVLLGDGIPLFGELESDLKLKLIGLRSYKNSFVQLTYKPKYE